MKIKIISGLCALFIGTVAFSQDAAIWLKRDGRKAGSGCGIQVQIGNQETFNVPNKQVVKYKIHSNGKISVSAELLMCAAVYNKQQISLKIETGKEYFLELNHGKPELIIVVTDQKESDGWKKEKFIEKEEDSENPIQKK